MKITEAIFVKSATSFSQYPGEKLPEVAFAGRSNVGKSSMINCLVGRRNFARISQVPGKTRTLNFYRINRAISFVDLPGYGYAQVSREMRQDWKRMINEYFTHRSQLRLLVLVVDLRRGLEEDEEDFLCWLNQKGIPVIITATKADKLNRFQRIEALKKIQKQVQPFGKNVLPFSSKTREGRDELWTQILKTISQTQIYADEA